MFRSFAIVLSLTLAAGLGGCTTNAPAAVERGQFTDLISVVGGMVVSTDGAPVPSPTPAPTPAPGICTNCNGKGRLGDGTISVPCPVCGGDGRTDNEPPPQPVSIVKEICPCGPACQCDPCECGAKKESAPVQEPVRTPVVKDTTPEKASPKAVRTYHPAPPQTQPATRRVWIRTSRWGNRGYWQDVPVRTPTGYKPLPRATVNC